MTSRIADSPKLDVFTYDVGAEVRAPSWITGKAVTFTPFAGVGRGWTELQLSQRSTSTRRTTSRRTAASAVSSASRRVRVRLEARDYVTGFKPLSGAGAARTGNDVVLMAGLRFVAR